MPYDIETKDGIVLTNIPDEMPKDDPRLKQMVAEERGGRNRRKMSTPEMKQKVALQQAQDRASLDPTEGMSATDKTLANLGAGYANVGQGIHQLASKVGLADPVPDADVQEKRAIDQRLADATQAGIGPDWAPSAGKALQFAGEVAPTAIIPGGALARAGSIGSRMLPRALMATAGRRAALGGAIGGGASGALMPTTEDESRVINTGVGAAAGAALPLAVGAARGLRANFGPGRRAAQQLVGELGPEADVIPQQVAAREAQRAGTTQAAQAIPESLAEATGSTTAGGLEAASAKEMNPEWAAFKRAQNVARHEAVQQATQEAPMAAQRMTARDLVADPMREAAMGAARQGASYEAPVLKAAQDMLTSSEAVNPSVRRVADYVLSAMDERAPTKLTPEGLYTVRKVLKEKLHGPHMAGDELSAAVKGADVQTLKLIDAIDQSLNQASGGRWGRYLSTYGSASRPVDASHAAQAVRDVFEREGVAELGGAPEVTATRLGQALRASEGGSRHFPLALSQPARQGVEDVLEHVTRANEVQKARKIAGTAGGGSQTSMDLSDLAHRALSPLGGFPVRAVRAALDFVSKGGHAETQRELVGMLQNPQAAVRAIQEAQRLNRPLTSGQRVVLQALSTGAGGALPRTMQATQGY
jgi:hypothetical protein